MTILEFVHDRGDDCHSWESNKGKNSILSRVGLSEKKQIFQVLCGRQEEELSQWGWVYEWVNYGAVRAALEQLELLLWSVCWRFIVSDG